MHRALGTAERRNEVYRLNFAHPALGCAECLLHYLASGRNVDQLPAIIRSGIPVHSNTLKYSSNRYTLPHLLPVTSRRMPTFSKAAMSL